MDLNKSREEFNKNSLIKHNIRTASELRTIMSVSINDPEKVVRGIYFTKGLFRQPHRGDVFGLLSGSGVGKTTTCIYMARDILESNPEDFVVIISLEMTVNEYLQKCLIAFGNEYPELLERLIIIDCYNSDGSNKELTVASIKVELQKIKQFTGKTLSACFIDHFHEIHNNGSVDFNPIAKDIKNLAVECDTLVVLPSQTTKEKGIGDVPVPKNGCFGCSRYENLCSYILTIFQPLRRVQNECDLPALGWQLCKIRFKNGAKDTTKEEVNYLLKYDAETETFDELDNNEKFTFQMYYDKVLELRENEEKKKAYAFDLSTTIMGKDGKEVKLTKIYTGGASLED